MALAPGGGGGGVGGDAATGALAGAIFGPVGVAVGAAIGVTIGVLAAQKKNKRLKKFAKKQQRRINEKITQLRVNRLIQMEALARAGRTELGDSLNAAPHNLAVIETLASRVVANVARDQETIDENRRRGELAAQAAKDDVVEGTESQVENVALAALGGAVLGANVGGQLGSAFDNILASRAGATLSSNASAANEATAGTTSKTASSQSDTQSEFLNLARATTNRITSKIPGATVARTFSFTHLNKRLTGTAFPRQNTTSRSNTNFRDPAF